MTYARYYKVREKYRKLRSFQTARLLYDITVLFCQRYIDKRSRTFDQMVQAARSGVQNIAEGSVVYATSKLSGIKLMQVARASLEELRLDFEDFLRQRGLALWHAKNTYRKSLMLANCKDVDSVRRWIQQTVAKQMSVEPQKQILNRKTQYAEFSANVALVFLAIACRLLDRNISKLVENYRNYGEFYNFNNRN